MAETKWIIRIGNRYLGDKELIVIRSSEVKQIEDYEEAKKVREELLPSDEEIKIVKYVEGPKLEMKQELQLTQEMDLKLQTALYYERIFSCRKRYHNVDDIIFYENKNRKPGPTIAEGFWMADCY